MKVAIPRVHKEDGSKFPKGRQICQHCNKKIFSKGNDSKGLLKNPRSNLFLQSFRAKSPASLKIKGNASTMASLHESVSIEQVAFNILIPLNAALQRDSRRMGFLIEKAIESILIFSFTMFKFHLVRV